VFPNGRTERRSPKAREIHLHSGNYAQAIASFRRALQTRIPASKIPATAVLGWLGYSYARGGFRQKAQGVLAKLQEESGKRYVPPCNLALVHFGLKDREQGWRLLEEAWQDHSFWLAFLAPLTLRLIEAECDPRSLHLLRRMNLG
jgi:Flp pilus assembly protein TadD